MSKSLSVDLKDRGVDVVLVHPGYVKTDMTGGAGDISVEDSASSIINVLETKPTAGCPWYDYTGKVMEL